MNLLEELKSHLDIEFSRSEDGKLNEMRGVVNGVDQAVSIIMGKASRIVDRAFSKINPFKRAKKSFTVDMSGVDIFFDKCIIDVKVRKNEYAEPTYKGSFSPSKSLSIKDGKTIIVPFITANVQAGSAFYAKDLLKGIFAHELTHAYNTYQYAVKNNKTPEEVENNAFTDQRYKIISNARDSNNQDSNEQQVGYLNYLLNRMERNAFIAQLQQELYDVRYFITDSKTAMEAIRLTESWKKFAWLEENVGLIVNAPVEETHLRTTVMDQTNKIMGTNFKKFSDVQRYYTTRWRIFRKKYLTAASKIAYDVYQNRLETQKQQ